MSTAKAKAKKQPVPGYATTGKNDAITVTVGIVFLTLGLCFLLAMMTAGEGYIVRELAQGLNGLCGPVCVLFPVIMMFIGVLMLVSARHRVNARSGLIAMVLREDDELIGVGPYGVAKIEAEEVCRKARAEGQPVQLPRRQHIAAADLPPGGGDLNAVYPYSALGENVKNAPFPLVRAHKHRVHPAHGAVIYPYVGG